MAGGEILKEFLITLGYSVDSNGQRNFQNGVVAITAVVNKLAGSAAAAADAIFQFSLSAGKSLQDLYFMSQRTGSSAREINAFSYAIEQMGGSAEEAHAAMEGLGRALRTDPGAQAVVDLITGRREEGRGAAEQLFDITKAVKRLTDQGQYFVAVNLLQSLGLDENTIFIMGKMAEGIQKYGDDYRKFSHDFQLDSKENTEQGTEYMRSITKLGTEWTAFKNTIGADLGAILGPTVIEPLRLVTELVFTLERALKTLYHFFSGDNKKMVSEAEQTFTGLKNLFPRELKGPIKALPGAVSGAAGWLRGLVPGGAQNNIVNGPGVSLALKPWRDAMLPNNPGNLRSWGSNPVVGGFAKFPTAQEGLSAMVGNLLAYRREGFTSIRQIVSRWAPPGENNTSAYIRDVSTRLGLSPDQKLNLLDPSTLSRLTDAIIHHEQGSNLFSPSMIAQAVSGRLAGEGSKVVTLNQRTEVTVNGATDPEATGARVSSVQQRVNGDLVRNLAGVMQ